jgi:hypothetical protein
MDLFEPEEEAQVTPISLSECPVCTQPFPDFVKTAGNMATHLRTHHSDTSHYRHMEAQLKALGVGFCPIGGEARPLLKDKLRFKAHRCEEAVRRAQHNVVERDRPAEWHADAAWPEGVPFPPKGIAPPLALDMPTNIVKVIPDNMLGPWSDIVRSTFCELANSVESGNERALVRAVTDLLRLAEPLQREKRGGKSGNKLMQKKIDRRWTEMLREKEREQEEDEDIEWASSPEQEGDRNREMSEGEKDKRDDKMRKVKSAEGFMFSKEAQRAARVLRRTDEMQPETAASASRLLLKFPEAAEPISGLNKPPQNAPRLIMDLKVFIKKMTKITNSSAGGRTGLRGTHIKPLLYNESVMSELLRVLTLLINGEFPSWTHPYLVSQRLIALGEKDRPICIGEWLVRTASTLTARTVTKEAAVEAFFHKDDASNLALQLGTSVSGGCEVGVHVADALVHNPNTPQVIIACDGLNAYNSTSRVKACNATMSQFPQTSRFIHWLYGAPAMLQHGDHTLMAREGALQGCPLGGLIHDMGAQAPMVRASKEAARRRAERANANGRVLIGEVPPEAARVHVFAFRDDGYVVGPPEEAAELHQLFEEYRREDTGVVPSVEKTVAYVPVTAFSTRTRHHRAAEELADRLMIDISKVSTEGIKMFQVPLGTDEFVRGVLEDHMEEYETVLPLVGLMDPRAAVPFLRTTYMPIPTYLARCIDPALFRPYAERHDDKIFDTYVKITRDEDLTRDSYAFGAPFRHGGLGFRALALTSPAAYFASLINAASVLAEWDPGSIEAIGWATDHADFDPGQEHLPDFEGLPGKLVRAWQAASRDHQPVGVMPDSPLDMLLGLGSGDINTKKLQSKLTKARELVEAATAKDTMTPTERARTFAHSISGSSSLHTSAPTSYISLKAYLQNSKIRVGSHVDSSQVCVCGNACIGLSHVMSCPVLSGKFIRHDTIVELIRNMCKRAGLVARTEVKVVDGTSKRMDVVVYRGHQVFWFDISIVNPEAASYLNKDAIKTREQVKRGRWERHATALGHIFLPFVLNPHGGLGPGANSILAFIANAAAANHPYQIAVKDGSWKRVHKAQAVQKVAAVLAHTVEISLQEAHIRSQGFSARAILQGLHRVASVDEYM